MRWADALLGLRTADDAACGDTDIRYRSLRFLDLEKVCALAGSLQQQGHKDKRKLMRYEKQTA